MRVNSPPLGATQEKKKLNTPLLAAGFFINITNIKLNIESQKGCSHSLSRYYSRL